ncbi:GlcG/HbpS family heme-binding protein [Phenylobacterium immobile]|uniref:GlcG/HbpS family heme-binding protein n=1 Tax=Phenylobacterium immobile TaxID=21 RepID=UPI000B08DA2B|nr:heme-binding protein [Phenylobacterium immobile]
MSVRQISAVAAAVWLSTFGAHAQPLDLPPAAPPAPGPALVLAVEAAQTAVRVCETNGHKVSVAVIDQAGVVKAILSGDGASARSVIVAQRKAATTLAFARPTAAVVEAAKTDPAIAERLAANPAFFARAGAQPLMSKGVLIGAIGVSGAPGGEKDDVCGLAAVAQIQPRMDSGT